MSGRVLGSVSEDVDAGCVHETCSTQVKVVRELWLLREQARVQAAEREFLGRLQNVLDGVVAKAGRDEGEQEEELRSPRWEEKGLELGERVREKVALFVDDASVLRQMQAVTNMNPEFRAVLEGSPIEDSPIRRDNSWNSFLTDQRHVSNALSSEFSHHLERMLVGGRRRREEGRPPQQPRPSQSMSVEVDYDGFEMIPDNSLDGQYQRAVENHRGDATRYVVSAIRSLEREMAILKNVINASFDIQLDIQRSIRQEVAAAIASDATGPNVSVSSRFPAKPLKQGTCTICMEASIDSVLYTCGHMCSCSPCGRSLLASGLPCPICRAPVRDIVRAFTVNTGSAPSPNL